MLQWGGELSVATDRYRVLVYYTASNESRRHCFASVKTSTTRSELGACASGSQSLNDLPLSVMFGQDRGLI